MGIINGEKRGSTPPLLIVRPGCGKEQAGAEASFLMRYI
jgi:hypothetical protein